MKNGNPIRLRHLEENRSLDRNENPIEPNSRDSCDPSSVCIILPVDRNNLLLKKAWNKVCIKEIIQYPKEIAKIMNPSCLRVDMATTFLKSNSFTAHIPPINIVITEMHDSIILNLLRRKLNRISK